MRPWRSREGAAPAATGAGAHRLRLTDPSFDHLARDPFGSRMAIDEDRGRTDLTRRILRLVTLVVLFLLAVLTGMLVPPSWVVSH